MKYLTVLCSIVLAACTAGTAVSTTAEPVPATADVVVSSTAAPVESSTTTTVPITTTTAPTTTTTAQVVTFAFAVDDFADRWNGVAEEFGIDRRIGGALVPRDLVDGETAHNWDFTDTLRLELVEAAAGGVRSVNLIMGVSETDAGNLEMLLDATAFIAAVDIDLEPTSRGEIITDLLQVVDGSIDTRTVRNGVEYTLVSVGPLLSLTAAPIG